MYRYLFFIVFIFIIFLIHYFASKRFVSKLDISASYKRSFKILIYLNFISVLGYVYLRYNPQLPKILFYISSVSVGIVLLLFSVTFFYEIFFQIQKRVLFIKKYKRYFDLMFIVSIPIYVVIGIYSVEPKIVKVDIDEGVLPKSYKIAQISDLHIGRLVDRKFIRSVVEKINSQNVDLVVITGDLVDGGPVHYKKAIDELKKLKSRYGTFYIVGNHEYFYGVKKILNYVKSIGIVTLENSFVKLKDFYVVGVCEKSRRSKKCSMDMVKAFKGIPKDAATLLLAHQPKVIYELKGIKPSLILCGHTHGGQIWPFGYFVKLFQPYLKGLHKLSNKSYIYISSGTGFWGPPMRVGTKGEITIIKCR